MWTGVMVKVAHDATGPAPENTGMTRAGTETFPPSFVAGPRRAGGERRPGTGILVRVVYGDHITRIGMEEKTC